MIIIYISILIPCYNEKKNINLIYQSIRNVFIEKMDEVEIIFINDGSTDETFEELSLLYHTEKNIKVINFSRNFGKDAAIFAGLENSIGDYISIIDADLQQNPKYILEMITLLENNKSIDIVAAYQKNRKESKVLRIFKSSFYKIINKISDVEFFSSASDFRTLRRNVVKSVLSLNEKCRFSKGIFSWVGFNTYYIPYEVELRKNGESKWCFSKLFKYAIDGITSFSTIPLIISSIVGVLLCIISFIYMAFIIIKTLLFGEIVSGFPTIVCIMLFLFGVQFLFMGVFGQYLSKMFLEVKQRPIYIIKDFLGKQK